MNKILLIIFSVFISTANAADITNKFVNNFSSYLNNTLTPNEVRKGYRLLWDGKTTQGWKSANKSGFPKKGWLIQEGSLIVEASMGLESENGGDIVTQETFSDFELSVDFKLTKVGRFRNFSSRN